MRKIKQVDRPFVIFRSGPEGRRLYDSATSLEGAKAIARSRLERQPRERIEIYLRGDLVFTLENAA